jgi:hypothetical protein
MVSVVLKGDIKGLVSGLDGSFHSLGRTEKAILPTGRIFGVVEWLAAVVTSW